LFGLTGPEPRSSTNDDEDETNVEEDCVGGSEAAMAGDLKAGPVKPDDTTALLGGGGEIVFGTMDPGGGAWPAVVGAFAATLRILTSEDSG